MKEKLQGKTILVISIWESMWSLGEGAGVSDDFHFIRKALSCGLSVHVLAPATREAQSPLAGVSMHRYPNFFRTTSRLPGFLKRLIWLSLFQLTALPQALRLARMIRPDLVLGHSHYATLASRLAARAVGAKSMVKLFGVMDLVHMDRPRLAYLYKNFEQMVMLKIRQDGWLILDDGTRGKEAALRLGISEEKIHFLPNGVDKEWVERSYDKQEKRKLFSLPQDACIVLFLARLVKSKRPEMVIRAVREIVREGGSKMFFLFVGDGPLRERCERLASNLSVESSIRFLGVLPHSRIPELMAACDIFVSVSSLTNMALPTCEAMLCGLPVVALDVGDTSRIVQHEETGLLLEEHTPQALAASIRRLAEDAELRVALAEKARMLAKERFTDWDDRTDMEMEIMGALLAH